MGSEIMNLAAIGKTVVVAQGSGDYPALITRVTSAKENIVNLVTFKDGEAPAYPKHVKIHPDRHGALNAHLKDGQVHVYWPAKG